MEEKKKWNLQVYQSLAERLDMLINDKYRKQKGVVCSAAMLMFLHSKEEEQQQYVDFIKMAEGRGRDGSILEAAEKLLRESSKGSKPNKRR